MRALISSGHRQQVKSLVVRASTPFVSGRKRVVVLCYHSVHPSKSYRSATPQQFEEHLGWLCENCDVVPFHSVLERARAGPHERPVVAITFDDGYDDNHEYALPALERNRVTATFFVTVGLVERDPQVIARFCRLRLGSADAVAPMSWSQVRELRAAGMDVGSHTWTHPNLALLNDVRALEELSTSRRLLEDRLEDEVAMLAFPFGKPGRHFSDRTVDLARKAGYEMAAAVLFRRVRPHDSPYKISRFYVRGDPIEELRDKVLGGHDIIGAWQEHVPAWMARLVSPEDFAT